MIIALPLDETWPKIVGRLEKMRVEQKADCTVQELYDKCKTGEAYLYGTSEDDSFGIVQPYVHPFTKEPELFILAAWGRGMARPKHTEKFQALARGIGAKRIRMRSTRPGFQRTGWQVDEYVYSQEVR
jgi:hypothetical protein